MALTGSAPATPRMTPNKKRKRNNGSSSTSKDIADRQVSATFAPTKKKLVKGSKKLNKGTGKKLKKLDPEFTKAVKQVFDSKSLFGRCHMYHSGAWIFDIPPNENRAYLLAQCLGDAGYGNAFLLLTKLYLLPEHYGVSIIFQILLYKLLLIMLLLPLMRALVKRFLVLLLIHI